MDDPQNQTPNDVPTDSVENSSSETARSSPIPPKGTGFSAYVPKEPVAREAALEFPVETRPAPRRRSYSVMLFVLVFLIGLLMIPWLAEQIAYALNRGKERARAEVARKLLAELPDIEQRIPWVAKTVAPSVVGIRTISLDRQGGGAMDVGSGVIVDVNGSIGYVLTNNHVVAGAQYVMIRMNDGREIKEAEIVGRDQATDLAVLRIDGEHFEAIAWGDSSRIEVGDQVVAVGNPYDLGQTVTSGIISATERFNPIPSKTRVQEFLQTDAAINPGNSGGPLVDLKGELIGINTAIFSQTGGNLGIGFAIPSLLAKRVYEEIRKHGEVQHGWLGIYMDRTTSTYAELMKIEEPKGVVVAKFFPKSPARDAGMKIGDVLLRWGDAEIRDPLHLSHLIVLARPGTTQTVEIVRKGERIKLDVTLGTRPVDLQ